MKKIIIDKKRIFIFVAAFSVFIYTLAVIFSKEINNLDSILIVRTNFATTFFRWLTKVGNWYTIIIILLLSLILKNKDYFKYMSLNLITITLTNQALKFIIQRPRPNFSQAISVSGYSYPSGHAMISTAFYGFIFYLIYKSNLDNKYKILFGIFIIILIGLICISRVYLGVHYLTDVVAGASLAILYLSIYTYWLKKKNVKF